jgi:uncharacterized membrane protein YphA (DoxX/SURF4 family)
LVDGFAAVARWVFGLSAIDFGVAHLDSVGSVAPLVPAWIPPSQNFWAVLTGIAFVAAGLAILIRVFDVLAAKLLALMLLVFSILALAPLIVASPYDQGVWGSNAYNVTAVAAVWILACELQARRRAPIMD